jgi:hypothetical protein
MKIHSAAAILAATVLAACFGAGPQASGNFQTHASYERLFSAAVAATPLVGYHTTSVNRADGLITAEQNVIMGRGTAIGMSAVVSREGNVRTLHVTFVAPPGTFAMGDFNQNVGEYIAAVRASVPDIRQAAQ